MILFNNYNFVDSVPPFYKLKLIKSSEILKLYAIKRYWIKGNYPALIVHIWGYSNFECLWKQLFQSDNLPNKQLVFHQRMAGRS